MPKQLPGGFILEDEEPVAGPAAAVSPPGTPPGAFQLEEPPRTITPDDLGLTLPPLGGQPVGTGTVLAAPEGVPGEGTVLRPGGAPPEPGFWGTLGRGAYGLGRGVVAGTLGLPGNLLRGMPWSSYDPKQGKYVTKYVNPLPGSETIGKTIDWATEGLGLRSRPEPGTSAETAERVGSTFGEVVGPSKAFPGMSVGRYRDLFVALQSVAGEAVARDLLEGASPEELERSGKIGAGVAPLLYAILQGVTSKGLQLAGKGILPRHVDLPRAQEAAAAARGEVQAAREAGQTRLGTVQERQRLLEAGEEARLRPLETAEQVAKGELGTTKTRTAAETALAQEQARLQTQQAQEAATQARSAQVPASEFQEQALAPLAPEVQQLGPTPGVREPGAAVQQAVITQAEAATQARTAGQKQAVEKIINDIGPRLDDATFIDMTQRDLRPTFLKQRKVVGEAFDTVENALAGRQAVDIPGTRSAIGQLVKEARASGQPVDGQILQWAELGLSKAQKARLKGSGLDRAEQALKMVPEEKLDFKAVRDIENTLHAAGSGAPVGRLTQAPPRLLSKAVAQDLQDFFTSDAGTGMGPAIQLAKQEYSKFLTEWNNGVMRHLVDPRAGYQAQNFLKFLSNTQKAQLPELRAVLRHASPETQAAISAHVAADVYTKSLDAAGNVVPKTLKSQIERLQKSGVLGELFDEQQQKQLLDAVQDMTAKDPSILPQLRKALEGRAPEDAVRFVFEPGQLTRTQNYQTITDPAVFDQARRGWARQFLDEMPTMSRQQVHKQLTTMLREDNGVSQLALMFPEHEFPGAVARFKQMAQEYSQAAPRAKQLKGEATRFAEQARTTRAAGEEAVRLTQEAGAGQVAAATTRWNAAKDAVTEAETRLKDMQERGKGVLAETRKGAALELKQARAALKTAQAGLDTARKAAGGPPGMVSRFVSSAAPLGGLGSLLFGLASNAAYAPYFLAAGVAGGLYKAGQYGLPAFARTPRGEQLLREGLRGQYGSQAARWVHQVFVGPSGEDETGEAQAPPQP